MQKAIRIIFAAAIFAASAQALKVDIELGNRATKMHKTSRRSTRIIGPAEEQGPSGPADNLGNRAAKGIKASARKQGPS